MASFLQATLKALTAAAVAFSSGLVDPASSLARFPQQELVDAVEEAERRNLQAPERKRLLELLRHDDRPAVREQVARRSVALWMQSPEDAGELLRALSRDPSFRVRATAAEALGHVLERAEALERVSLVADWATSPSALERAALAMALRGSAEIGIADLALELLCQDASEEVRRFAVEAAGRRFEESRAVYQSALGRLSEDPVPAIRHRARVLLRELGHA